MRICDKCGEKAEYTIGNIFLWNENIKSFMIGEIDMCADCNVKLGEILKNWTERGIEVSRETQEKARVICKKIKKDLEERR